MDTGDTLSLSSQAQAKLLEWKARNDQIQRTREALTGIPDEADTELFDDEENADLPPPESPATYPQERHNYDTRSRWTVAQLVTALDAKGFDYVERLYTARLIGTAATLEGGFSTLTVKANLSEPDKIFLVARLLGHIARGHASRELILLYDGLPMMYTDSEDDDVFDDLAEEPSLNQDQRQWEIEAKIWAAHLLVGPKDLVFPPSRNMRTTHLQRDKEYIIEHTAEALGIPPEVVALYLETRRYSFNPPPRTWLASIA